jgi:hypothetical protein
MFNLGLCYYITKYNQLIKKLINFLKNKFDWMTLYQSIFLVWNFALLQNLKITHVSLKGLFEKNLKTFAIKVGEKRWVRHI